MSARKKPTKASAAPRGNKRALGNKGGNGGPNKYRADNARTAQRLCAMMGFTDVQLSEFFQVSETTIRTWRLDHPEFADAVKAGKAETDDYVEREVLKGISGYFVEHEETVVLKGEQVTRTVRKWVQGNPGVGMRWLAARRPEVYREIKEDRRMLSVDEAFMKALEGMNERALTRRSDKAKLIEHKPGV